MKPIRRYRCIFRKGLIKVNEQKLKKKIDVYDTLEKNGRPNKFGRL